MWLPEEREREWLFATIHPAGWSRVTRQMTTKNYFGSRPPNHFDHQSDFTGGRPRVKAFLCLPPKFGLTTKNGQSLQMLPTTREHRVTIFRTVLLCYWDMLLMSNDSVFLTVYPHWGYLTTSLTFLRVRTLLWWSLCCFGLWQNSGPLNYRIWP